MCRKFFTHLFVLLFYLVFAFQSHAVSINFTKDALNPLNTSFSLLQSTITKDSGGYKMWYTGHNGTNFKIGYSTSTNGTIWPSNTFVSINDTGDNHDPSLFIQGTNKYIYYVSEPSEGSGVDIKVKRAIANDSQFSTPQLINLQRQPWNSQKLSCPYVFAEDGNYFMIYCGTNGSSWTLGMAQSTDGQNFTPCSNNPIVSNNTPGNSQFYIDEEGIKHLLFHSDAGVEEVTTSGAIGCGSSWTNRKTLISKDKPYDQSQIISPTLVNSSSSKELFYIARGPATSGAWRLNRATTTPNVKPKIAIVPGFFASWNQNAVLYNQTVNQGDWKIPSYIQEYKALIRTLDNLGLVANRDYYVFPYDWRKPISSSADNLRTFLQTRIWNADQTAQVQLVGHSMGGVVSRIYAQKYPNDNVTKIVTAGSPHRGVVQVYQPLIAGETQKDDTFLWLGTKLLINLNRKNFNSDRKTVQTIIPSLYDLFPTFPFLKNIKGIYKPINSMTIKNTLLNTYANLGPVSDRMTVLHGNKAALSSPIGYRVIDRAIIDRFGGDYIDGRPISTFKGPGDYLVPNASSVFGSNVVELLLDHGELIYTKTAIRSILNSLSLSFEEGDLVEGSPTQFSSALVIAIQSPIEASVQIGSQTYYAEDGLIFIPNAQTGTYTLSAKKLSPGDYTVTVAQIAQKNDVWEQFTGTIIERNVSEEDKYVIKYDTKVVKPQISTRSCEKIKRSFFSIKRRLLCKIKNLRIR